MKNRADAEALPKFPGGASTGSREEDEPLDDAGMAEREQHMAVRGSTAARLPGEQGSCVLPDYV